MKLTIPFPPWILSPNSRAHWAKKMPAKNKMYLIGINEGKKVKKVPEGFIPLVIDFFPPNDKPDLDNCLNAIKSALDGIAKSMGVNDKRFRPITIDIPYHDKKNPRVEITIGSVQSPEAACESAGF